MAKYLGNRPTAVPIQSSDLEDDIVTLAKLSSGTDGNIISYDASGNPVAIATGSDGQVLTSAGAGQPPAFEAVSAGTALTGSTDNTITTVTGANAIQGEANFTYDGTTLQLSQATPILKILPTTNGNSGKIELCGRSTDGSPTENRTQIIATPEGSTANTFLAFHVEDSGGVDEKMRISSTGNTGIGVTDPDAKLEVNGKFKVSNSMSGDNIMLIENSANDGYGPYFKGGGTGTASQFVFRFTGYDGTERLRMDGLGKLLVNKTSTFGDANSLLYLNGPVNVNPLYIKIGSNGYDGIRFYNAATSEVGSVQIDSTGVVYNTTSDYRLKENETSITDGIDRVKQLKPYRFNFKTEPDKTLDGFMAHEVSGIVPEAITGEKDAMHPEVLYDEEILYTADDELPEGKNIGDVKHSIGDVKEATKINPQGIDQSKLVPLLTSALQEAITKIETLEAKVTALENA